MKSSIFSLALMAFAAMPAVQAHMFMSKPPCIKAKSNPHAMKLQQIDYDMVANLDASGKNFPCKGYHKLTGDHANPVDTWGAGPQQLTLEGNARHNGGSCQFSVSEDGGTTFRVIGSIEGGCLADNAQAILKFLVPEDVKKGKHLFAWTWYNNTGNRELYMNCAWITFTTNGKGLGASPAKYPEIFKANISNGCSTAPGSDVKFPAPGIKAPPQTPNSPPKNLKAPEGKCTGGRRRVR